ncbi:MBL fold metallo-hydrolase [Candidatus Parcubacteria bacterium]|nr:MAG: MBL fold metallo-hydrolase [Candidatus Parcubacteria bacterium]
MNKLKTVFLLIVVGLGVLFYTLKTEVNDLEINFFAIGQGDAILIRTPEGQNILIDGGPDNLLLYHLGETLPWWERTIDYLVITHYHADHYLGFPELLKKYRVKNILVTAHQPDDFLYSIWQQALVENNLKPSIVLAGEKFVVSDDLSWQVLLADYNHEDFNENSLVLRLTYGNTNFLFAGDLPISGEQKLLSLGFDLSSQVLKVGHHGSKYSSGSDFLSAVDPDICVIQSGQDNKFGHPHQEALVRLAQANCLIFDTQNGDSIKLISDGQNIDVY